MIASPAGSVKRIASLFGRCCLNSPCAMLVLCRSGFCSDCSKVPLNVLMRPQAAIAFSIVAEADWPEAGAVTTTAAAAAVMSAHRLIVMRVLPHLNRRRSGSRCDRAADGAGDGANLLHQPGELIRKQRLTSVGKGAIRIRMHLDDDSVGPGGDRRPSHRRDLVPQ